MKQVTSIHLKAFIYVPKTEEKDGYMLEVIQTTNIHAAYYQMNEVEKLIPAERFRGCTTLIMNDVEYIPALDVFNLYNRQMFSD
jgi:hypothetical protein